MRGLPQGLSPQGTVPLRKSQRGYLLITVVVMLFLLASVAMLLNHDSAISAHTASSELESARADYVAEAALQHALWRTGNNSCMGNVTIPATPLGPDSYSATITGAAPGTSYELAADQDAWVRSDDVTKNNGTTVSNHVRSESGNIERVLTRFDLSTLPANAQINSATAWFHLKAGKTHPEGSITIHEVTADWTETGVTWETFNDTYASARVGMIPAQDTGDVWVAINLTGLVQAWVNGQPNYGVLFDPQAEGIHTEYTAREDGSNPPRLEVVVGSGPASPVTIKATGELDNGVKRKLKDKLAVAYQPPGTVTLQLGTDPGADVLIDSFYERNYGGSDYLQVNGDPAWLQRLLLKFALGRIPAHAKVLSARLELSVMSIATAGTATVHRVTRSWVEGTQNGGGSADGATWSTFDGSTNWTSTGGDFNAPVVAATTIDPADTWVAWEIGPLVQQWLAGEPNDGLLIQGDAALRQAKFASRENSNTAVQPKLTITYACECGSPCMAPQGTGRIALIGDDNSPDPDDQLKIQVIESWGYEVDFYQDQDSDTINWSNYDLAYVSETVISGDVSANLTDLSIGVVNEEPKLYDDLQLASGDTGHVGSSINIIDNSHFITAIFPQGPLSIYTGGMEILTADAPLAGGLQTLGEFSGAATLTALDLGAQTTSGTAAARRVTLPLGQHFAAGFDWTNLGHNGHLLVQRAIAWGMNADAGCADGNFRDEFNTAAFDNDDGSLNWPGDWIEVDASGLGTGSGKAQILSGEIRLQGTPSGDSPSLAREIDLSGFQSATLTFDFRTGSGVEAGEDGAVAEVSADGGGSWTVLEDFINEGPSASGSRSNDITPYLASDTQVRFRVNVLYGGPNEYFYVDDVDIAASCDPLPAFKVLMVVTDPGSPAQAAADRKALMESWGYTVTLIDDDDSQPNFDAGITAADVIYVGSGTTSTSSVTQMFDDTTKGVVNEPVGRASDIGFASSWTVTSGDQLTIVDGTHSIMQGFADPITVFTASMTTSSLSGTFSPELQILAESGAAPAIVVLESGATKHDVGVTTGRRAQLPFAQAEGSDLTADGQLIVQRAIEWAAGAGVSPLAPIAHWKLDEASGPTAVDSEGGHDGTWTNGPTPAPGVVDGGLAFDGSNDHVRVSHSSDFELADGTIVMWINAVDVAGEQFLFFKEGADKAFLLIKDGEITYETNGDTLTATVLADDWTHVAITFGAGGMSLYLDGSLVANSTKTDAMENNTGDIYIGTDNFEGKAFGGTLDDVRIYDRVLDAAGIAALAASGSGSGGGGGPGYFEKYILFTIANADTWQTVDLSVPGVPANAVAEIAITNSRTGSERWGGVRATGSGLDRRFQLHEAEGGGVDAVVMHVQVDSNGHIEAYSDNTSEVTFRLLGYWTGATYVETFDTFQAGGSNSWRAHNLDAYGVGPNQVAEMVISNKSTSTEYRGGVRSNGSALVRRIQIHEAESGGVDTVTRLTVADGTSNATVEVYTESNSNMDFTLVGYWSVAPGTFTELSGQSGTPSAASSWETKNLSSFTIPANAVVRAILRNLETGSERTMGVRAAGSSLSRTVDLQEAEAGGANMAGLHVSVDSSGNIQWFSEAATSNQIIVFGGYWEFN